MDKTAITSVRWVPRGVALAEPQTEVLKADDIKDLVAEMKDMNITSGHEGIFEDDKNSEIDQDKFEENKTIATKNNDNLLDEFNLDNYDNDDNMMSTNGLQSFPGDQFFGVLEADLPDILNDPYLKKDTLNDSDEEDEQDAQKIRPTDSLLLAGSADQELPTLEVYVYDQDNQAFYVHHDIMVGSPPLCIEWLDRVHSGDNPGNFCAVGSYGHCLIEIWNLDILDQLEPELVLGQLPSSKKNKKKSSLNNGPSIPGHVAEVLTLHKNPRKTNILASGSADHTVKIWDLVTPVCVSTHSHHTDKVQTVQWHSLEQPILLSAAYDKTVSVIDVRVSNTVLQAKLPDEAESCIWSRHNPTTFLVSTEDGKVSAFDFRTLQTNKNTSCKPLWSLQAHEKSCSGIADCGVPNLLLTCSIDGHAKVWNTADGAQPSFVYDKDLKAGPLFCVSSNPDEPTLFSIGGNVVVIWDIADSNIINRTFGLPEVEEPVIQNSVSTKAAKSLQKLRH